MVKPQITAIIVAKNEAEVISDALNSVEFCDHVIHIDNGSQDATSFVVSQHGGKTITTTKSGYHERKNEGLKHVSTPWVLFLDADERITPLLRQEILETITSLSPAAAYEIPRRNIYLGKEMKFGGWGNDSVVRLFQTTKLDSWQGSLHEQPKINGTTGKLNHEIVHFSHRDLESMVEKTVIFSQEEAQLRFSAQHPPITWWRFFRVMLSELWLRLVKFQAFRDGTEGIIDGLFQVFNMFIIYARLWEAQQVINSPNFKSKLA